jgi:hypothetical protein
MDEVEIFGPFRSIKKNSSQMFAFYSISTMDVFFANLPQDESINRFHKN